mmetsp:Transcript_51123/g.153617  ORF Transcript_51123/g.153617 Transcript_51123/m.153617 type:complete len:228 (+) Transcript_51123:446-1129(+)
MAAIQGCVHPTMPNSETGPSFSSSEADGNYFLLDVLGASCRFAVVNLPLAVVLFLPLGLFLGGLGGLHDRWGRASKFGATRTMVDFIIRHGRGPPRPPPFRPRFRSPLPRRPRLFPESRRPPPTSRRHSHGSSASPLTSSPRYSSFRWSHCICDGCTANVRNVSAISPVGVEDSGVNEDEDKIRKGRERWVRRVIEHIEEWNAGGRRGESRTISRRFHGQKSRIDVL